ncbi:hypothetical protein [Chryseobacterium shigense]|uniref:hypothetical protein n=1 Tax=Chryseobacterium shigense TaxID=297244 RepID=UPI0013FE3282|nr:hypothetical protein [Chryseobacterium shigense]
MLKFYKILTSKYFHEEKQPSHDFSVPATFSAFRLSTIVFHDNYHIHYQRLVN